MGLDFNGTRFLLYARSIGVDFDQTAMIGRQSLDLTKYELKKSFQSFGCSINHDVLNEIFTKNNGYAESFLAQLGAMLIHSFDISSYEDATYVHDMNYEIPPKFVERYSVVIDGGSLEHVFNFPVAVKNCMEMLKLGGYYLGISPANNFFGHGFYQFSPELYFSLFTKKNGFELITMIAFEDKINSTWYSVKNPKEIKSRVSLVNDQPVYLLIIAKKVEKAVIFKETPQQSDYLATWNKDDNEKKVGHHGYGKLTGYSSPIRNWIKRNLPLPIRYFLKNVSQGSGFSPKFFSPFDPSTIDLTSVTKRDI